MKPVETRNNLSREDLLHLTDQRQPNSISIYMPTVSIGPEIQQNPIRLKNLLDQVREQLGHNGLGTAEIGQLVEPLEALVDSGSFWQPQSKGLAIFRSSNELILYKLPIHFQESVTVNNHFYTKPLIPMLEGNGKFYLLALSMNRARLFEADKFKIRELDLGDTPVNMDEALGYDNVQRELQFHTNAPARAHGERSAMFFGQGVTNEEQKKGEILRFFHILDKGVYKKIGDQSSPLVLAGVEYLIPIYRDATEYPHLYHDYVTGNPDEVRPEELHKEAWDLVAPFYQQTRNGVLDGYHILANSKQASKDVSEIVPAAYFGQVDTLFVSTGLRIWGTFNSENSEVQVHDRQQPGDEDLTDLATAYTLANAGRVYTFDPATMPDGAMIAATLRYPLKGLNYASGH